MHAAIYARFSSEKQRETSTEDQARGCRARAEALGLEIVAVHFDQGVSGSTPVAARAGGRALIDDALADRFAVLILEGLDRLSRDSVEQETIVRRLEHRGIRIIGIADGYDSAAGKSRKLTRGMRGLINEIYLDDLREKTHRGIAGQLERGFHAGGLSYGYRSTVAGVDARGEAIGHRLEINTEQAVIVREIFARYAGGESCQRIAAALNARGVHGPRGGTWCVSALYGAPAKGAGLLNNELYIGRYVWNRSQWVKDPDSGKRKRMSRPQAEWCIANHPELRILNNELWQAARDRMSGARIQGGLRGRGGIPTTLFGGLLRCGICGGAVVAVSASSYGCAARKDRGETVCLGMTVRRRDVDSKVVDHLRAAMADPVTLAWVEQEVARRMDASRRDRTRDRDASAVKAAALEREAGRLVDAIATVGTSPTISARLAKVEAELASLQKRPQARSNVAALPSAVSARVRAMAGDLEAALTADIGRAREALRATLGELRLVADGDDLYVEYDNAAERLMVALGGVSMGRVAGTCNTTRLHIGKTKNNR